MSLTGLAAGAAAAVSETATDAALLEGAILLGVATLFVLIFRRLGLGAVLGYLIAGALVGPHGLGLVGGGESKLAFAEIGIAFLLFLVGLELHPRRLWDLRRAIFGLGLAQVVVTGLILAGLIFVTLGFSWQAALALGLPLALSSTAQVLPSLKSSGRINSPFGQKAFSILLFQDLAIVPMITIIAALSRAPANPAAPPGWQMALTTVGAIAVLVLVGRFVVNPLLRLVGRYGERELFVVVGLLAVLASAAFMHSLHLSTALGAFVAGMMLADSPYRHEIEADVEPFRLVLLGLFFLAVGMVLDVGVVAARPLLVLSLAAGLVVVKAAVLTILVRLFGKPWSTALGLGLLLSQGGEFGFLLFTQAADALLIAPEAASLFSAVVTLSMVTTPFLMLFALVEILSQAYAQINGAQYRMFQGKEGNPRVLRHLVLTYPSAMREEERRVYEALVRNAVLLTCHVLNIRPDLRPNWNQAENKFDDFLFVDEALAAQMVFVYQECQGTFSGSMEEPAGGGLRRIDVFQQAALAAVQRFPGEAELGVWVFSTERVGGQDWEDLVPVEPLADPAQLARIAEVIDSLPGRLGGATGLYDTVLAATDRARQTWEPDKVNSVLLRKI